MPAPDYAEGTDSRLLNAEFQAALDAANRRLLGWMGWYRDVQETYGGE